MANFIHIEFLYRNVHQITFSRRTSVEKKHFYKAKHIQAKKKKTSEKKIMKKKTLAKNVNIIICNE